MEQKTAKKRERKSKLLCYYTNTDSLPNKKHELNMVLSIRKPDIVIITEILPKNCEVMPQEDEFEIPGYNLFSNLNEDNCREEESVCTPSLT